MRCPHREPRTGSRSGPGMRGWEWSCSDFGWSQDDDRRQAYGEIECVDGGTSTLVHEVLEVPRDDHVLAVQHGDRDMEGIFGNAGREDRRGEVVRGEGLGLY